MAGNSFGQAFRITTAGESHGPANVVIIDGCPPGIPLSVEDLAVDTEAQAVSVELQAIARAALPVLPAARRAHP